MFITLKKVAKCTVCEGWMTSGFRAWEESGTVMCPRCKSEKDEAAKLVFNAKDLHLLEYAMTVLIKEHDNQSDGNPRRNRIRNEYAELLQKVGNIKEAAAQ